MRCMHGVVFLVHTRDKALHLGHELESRQQNVLWTRQSLVRVFMAQTLNLSSIDTRLNESFKPLFQHNTVGPHDNGRLFVI
jgi:hypothetical protein